MATASHHPTSLNVVCATSQVLSSPWYNQLQLSIGWYICYSWTTRKFYIYMENIYVLFNLGCFFPVDVYTKWSTKSIKYGKSHLVQCETFLFFYKSRYYQPTSLCLEYEGHPILKRKSKKNTYKLREVAKKGTWEQKLETDNFVTGIRFCICSEHIDLPTFEHILWWYFNQSRASISIILRH